MWNPTHLQVTVHKAKDLIAKGKNGTNDAYVTIQLAKEKFQTSVRDKSTNPKWDEECDLPIPKKKSNTSPSSELKITVYNRSLIGIDNFLGQLILPLDELPIYDRIKNKWYPLRGKTDSKKPAKDRGMLDVRIEFTVHNNSSDPSKKMTLSNKLSTSTNALSGSSLSLGPSKRKLSIKSFASSVGGKLNLKSRSKLGNKNEISGSRESLNKKSPFNLRKESLIDATVFEADFDESEAQIRGQTCRDRNSLSSGKKPVAQSMLDLRGAKTADFPKITKHRDSKKSLFGKDIFGKIKRPNSINCSDSPDLNSLCEEGLKEYFSSDLEQARNNSTTPSPSAASQRLKASNQSLNGSLASSRGGSSRPSSALFDSSPVSVDSKANGVLIHSVDRSASLNSKKDEKHSSSIYGNSKIENWADSDLYRHDDIIDINRMKCHELNNQGHDLYTDDYSKMSRQDLEQLARKQALALRHKDKTIDHLDCYIDNIVARAMESAPYLLQYPFSNDRNTMCETLKNNELNKLPPKAINYQRKVNKPIILKNQKKSLAKKISEALK